MTDEQMALEAAGETGTFTVEAHIEGVSEEWAEALAVILARLDMTVWIKGSDEV